MTPDLTALVAKWRERADRIARGREGRDHLHGCADELEQALAALPSPARASCSGGDPACPCQDGDPCHYVATATTKAMPLPSPVVGETSRETRVDQAVAYAAGAAEGRRYEREMADPPPDLVALVREWQEATKACVGWPGPAVSRRRDDAAEALRAWDPQAQIGTPSSTPPPVQVGDVATSRFGNRWKVEAVEVTLSDPEHPGTKRSGELPDWVNAIERNGVVIWRR